MREEPFDFRRAQAGGRFVEDEQFRVAVECSGDGDFLLLRGREIAERPRGGNLKLASRKLRGGLSVQASPVHAAPAVTGPTFAEQEILGHGQVAAVRQLLMNRRDAGVDGVVRRREANGSSLPLDCPGVRGMQAAEDLAEGGFSGAVLTDESHDLALGQGEIERLESARAGEGFLDGA